jgi:hypothetical protein
MATAPDPTTASLTFLPWVRQGVAAAITAVDTLTAKQPGVVNLNAALTVNTSPTLPVSVSLRGPADVVGIDANQVVRTDPRPGSVDFEPSYFPLVEFDRPDFPWLFTPASADANSKLRPWLCLVVVRKQEGVTLGTAIDAPLPVLQISAPAKPADELPDLKDCWAWTHAQAAAADNSEANVRAALNGPPNLQLSRLICPRVLVANTDYMACVVPTFELGRKAGLGIAIKDTDLVAATALAPAWSLTPVPTQVTLPVYYHWEFRTGPGGDFATLVSALRPHPAPPELGRRPIDISNPGFQMPKPLPAGTTLKIESALRPILPKGAPDTMEPWSEDTALPFQTKLAEIVNAPGESAVADPKADPLLAPPLYGQWHAARTTVTRTGTDWFDQLNLDPRLRSAAAFGTRVIQDNQEALMASAWEQAADLQEANQRMRQLQMSLAVGESLHVRHFSRLIDEHTVRVAGPALSRLRATAGAPEAANTMMAQMSETRVPVQAISPAMRRIGRQRGPITRRAKAQGGTRSATNTWVATLGAGTAELPVSTWFDAGTVSQILSWMNPPPSMRAFAAVTADVVHNFYGHPVFTIAPEGQPVVVPPISGLPPGVEVRSPTAMALRSAAYDHLKRVDPARAGTIGRERIPVAISELQAVFQTQTRPQQTMIALTHVLVSTAPDASSPTTLSRAIASPANPSVDTIMVAPSFPQPMYEPLRDLSQDLLLPGLDAVPPDTVLGLETNRRFVEAFMVGLNFEMAHELLWRGYPTDQRGTYFKQFWGGGDGDISPLHLWGNRALGDGATAPAREKFVMLLRSALLRRYPNAVIYLAPAQQGGSHARTPSEDPSLEKQPVFACSMQPDIAFFGFDVTADQATGADGGSGYYVVIQEHPTEPRFGLHPGVSAGNVSHVPVGTAPPKDQPTNGLIWGRNAAHMGGIVRRIPFRLAIHASLFLPAAPAPMSSPPPVMMPPIKRPPVILSDPDPLPSNPIS